MRKIPLTPIAKKVLEKRYLTRNYQGDILETPEQMFRRVARAVAEADNLFEVNAPVSLTADLQRIYDVLYRLADNDNDKGFRAYQLLRLTQSTELEAFLKSIPDVSLPDMDTIRYFRDERVFDLVALDGLLDKMPQELFQMESFASRNVDSEITQTLRQIRQDHSNPIYRVGAIVTLFALVVDFLNRNRNIGL